MVLSANEVAVCSTLLRVTATITHDKTNNNYRKCMSQPREISTHLRIDIIAAFHLTILYCTNNVAAYIDHNDWLKGNITIGTLKYNRGTVLERN